MKKQFKRLIVLTATSALGFALTLPVTLPVDAQSTPVPQRSPNTRPTVSNFPGRGVAHGALFNRGRNVNVTLTVDGDNFGLEMTEQSSRTPGRVQYRGVVMRRNADSRNPNSFTMDARVRSFDTSANLRVLNNTTGTCRIEVFDSRVISSNCTTVSDNSSTRFLGLERF